MGARPGGAGSRAGSCPAPRTAVGHAGCGPASAPQPPSSPPSFQRSRSGPCPAPAPAHRPTVPPPSLAPPRPPPARTLLCPGNRSRKVSSGTSPASVRARFASGSSSSSAGGSCARAGAGAGAGGGMPGGGSTGGGTPGGGRTGGGMPGGGRTGGGTPGGGRTGGGTPGGGRTGGGSVGGGATGGGSTGGGRTAGGGGMCGGGAGSVGARAGPAEMTGGCCCCCCCCAAAAAFSSWMLCPTNALISSAVDPKMSGRVRASLDRLRLTSSSLAAGAGGGQVEWGRCNEGLLHAGNVPIGRCSMHSLDRPRRTRRASNPASALQSQACSNPTGAHPRRFSAAPLPPRLPPRLAPTLCSRPPSHAPPARPPTLGRLLDLVQHRLALLAPLGVDEAHAHVLSHLVRAHQLASDGAHHPPARGGGAANVAPQQPAPAAKPGAGRGRQRGRGCSWRATQEARWQSGPCSRHAWAQASCLLLPAAAMPP